MPREDPPGGGEVRPRAPAGEAGTDEDRQQRLREGVAEIRRAVTQLRGEVEDVRRRVERLQAAVGAPAPTPPLRSPPGMAGGQDAGAEALASSEEVLQYLKGVICAELGILDPAEVERITAEEIARRIHDLHRQY